MTIYVNTAEALVIYCNTACTFWLRGNGLEGSRGIYIFRVGYKH